MALFTPSESPAVVVKEVDLTGGVPNVQSTTGAFVGNFNWGPVETPILVANESGLVEAFGTPDASNSVDFHSAAYFLRYASTFQVVRAVTSDAVNAFDTTYADSATAGRLIKNSDDFDAQDAAADSDGHSFVARYPGALGNSIKISAFSAEIDSADTAFTSWTYADYFDGEPGTSQYASDRNSSNDELHIAIIDEDGQISGTVGGILETFPYLSIASDAKNADGSSNYYKDVINSQSKYIRAVSLQDYNSEADTSTSATTNFNGGAGNTLNISLSNGVNSTALTTSEYATGFDLFEDVDTITVDFLIAPGMSARADQTTVVNDLVAIAGSTRKDCIVIASPARSDVVNNSTPVADTVTTANTFTNSSYLFVDNNYLKVYDKYNDQYIFIPAASSTAGIMAASDNSAAPWFSPAGSRRGSYLGVTALSYSPTKAERDTLYKAGVNPVANIPGQGILLFGDKTKLSRPSAFDRVNVRRLFLTIERAVSIAARNVMFEFNDEFTRAEFVNIIEPFLREIQGRRGVTDFRVICDETNNTAAVVDRNEFIANIFIKPARSINYVTLNFVAVRSGVQFEEVVGSV